MITFFLFLLVAIVFVLFFIVILSRLFGSNRKKFYRFCRIVSLASSFFVLAAILSLYLESNARFFTIPVTVEKNRVYTTVFSIPNNKIEYRINFEIDDVGAFASNKYKYFLGVPVNVSNSECLKMANSKTIDVLWEVLDEGKVIKSNHYTTSPCGGIGSWGEKDTAVIIGSIKGELSKNKKYIFRVTINKTINELDKMNARIKMAIDPLYKEGMDALFFVLCGVCFVLFVLGLFCYYMGRRANDSID